MGLLVQIGQLGAEDEHFKKLVLFSTLVQLYCTNLSLGLRCHKNPGCSGGFGGTVRPLEIFSGNLPIHLGNRAFGAGELFEGNLLLGESEAPRLEHFCYTQVVRRI